MNKKKHKITFLILLLIAAFGRLSAQDDMVVFVQEEERFCDTITPFAHKTIVKERAVEAYDLAMGIIGVKNIGSGVVHFAKELPDNVITLIKNNRSIRAQVAAKYLDWQEACKKIKKLTLDELDNLGRQESVWRSLGLLPEKTHLLNPNISKKIKTSILYSGESMDKLVRINIKAALNYAESADVKWMQNFIGAHFPPPQQGEMLRKIITLEDFQQYHVNAAEPYLRRAGFITKAEDYVIPGSSEDMIEYLRLDYEGTNFSGEKGFVCIEFKNNLPDVDHPFKVPHDAYEKLPYTNTGCTGSSQTIIPEYYSSSQVNFSDGDVAKVFDSKGNVTEIYKYSKKKEKWIK